MRDTATRGKIANKGLTLGLALIALLVVACQGASDSPPEVSGWTPLGLAQHTTQEAMLERHREQAYASLRERFEAAELTAEEFDRASNAIAFGSLPIDEAQIERVPEGLSIEQLAERLRPVTVIGDWEYVGEPNYELAGQVFSGQVGG
jgi:hypothetical protein